MPLCATQLRRNWGLASEVTLFAPLALWNVVRSPQLILPQELGSAAEHADKRQHPFSIRHVDETLHHGAAENQVECPNPTN